MGELNLLANLQKEFVVSKSTLAWQPQINAPHEVFSGHLDGIQVYIAKFHFDNDRAELVSGVNRYYNIDHWTKKSHTHVALDQGKVGALQLVNVSGVNIRLYYWFEVDGIKTQGLLATKINQLKSKLQGNGGRGSFVAVAHNDQDRVGSLALKLSPFL
jgi:hypothetical protein